MFLPYKRYADFTGRSTRKEFWLFALFLLVVSIFFLGLMLAGGYDVGRSGSTNGESQAMGLMFYVGAGGLVLFWLGSFIPNLAVTVRRFHDRDMSGWWVLGFGVLSNIPYIGGLISIAELVILALAGTKGHNRFGEDPLDPDNADVFA